MVKRIVSIFHVDSVNISDKDILYGSHEPILIVEEGKVLESRNDDVMRIQFKKCFKSGLSVLGRLREHLTRRMET